MHLQPWSARRQRGVRWDDAWYIVLFEGDIELVAEEKGSPGDVLIRSRTRIAREHIDLEAIYTTAVDAPYMRMYSGVRQWWLGHRNLQGNATRHALCTV